MDSFRGYADFALCKKNVVFGDLCVILCWVFTHFMIKKSVFIMFLIYTMFLFLRLFDEKEHYFEEEKI